MLDVISKIGIKIVEKITKTKNKGKEQYRYGFRLFISLTKCALKFPCQNVISQIRIKTAINYK